MEWERRGFYFVEITYDRVDVEVSFIGLDHLVPVIGVGDLAPVAKALITDYPDFPDGPGSLRELSGLLVLDLLLGVQGGLRCATVRSGRGEIKKTLLETQRARRGAEDGTSVREPSCKAFSSAILCVLCVSKNVFNVGLAKNQGRSPPARPAAQKNTPSTRMSR
jgi:hypothetical protein